MFYSNGFLRCLIIEAQSGQQLQQRMIFALTEPIHRKNDRFTDSQRGDVVSPYNNHASYVNDCVDATV
jgi:hypothetical protein